MLEYRLFFSKYQLLVGLIFLFSTLRGQEGEIRLVTCEDNSPIKDAYILDETEAKVIGFSNENGRIVFFSDAIEWPKQLKVYKMSALDTSIVVFRSDTKLCLNPSYIRLPEFEIISEQEDISESFEHYLNKTFGLLKDSDTTYYYAFTWSFTLPDSNWTMDIDGVIKFPHKSYLKFNSGAYAAKFCEMEIRLDSSFYLSDFMENIGLNYIASTYLFQSDYLRKRFPFQKRIKNEYIIDKNSKNGLTTFTYARPVKKDLKLLLSYPVFNSDSIIIENNYNLQLIEKQENEKYEYLFLDETYKVGYAIIDGKISLSSIEVLDKLRTKSGSMMKVEFNAFLLTDFIPQFEEVYIMNEFNKENFDQLKKLKGYQVILK